MSVHQYPSLSERQMKALGLHEVIPDHEAFEDLDDLERLKDILTADDLALQALVAEHTA